MSAIKRFLPLVLSAFVVLTGCSKVAEKVIESKTGATIDTKNGVTKVSTSDGVYEQSGGTTKISTKDGAAVIGGNTLPSDWPDAIPKPTGTIASSVSGTQSGKKTVLVNVEVDNVKTWFADYKAAITAKGFTVANDTSGSTSGKFFGTFEADSSAWKVSVFATETDGGKGTVALGVDVAG